MKYGNFITKEHHAFTDTEKNEVLSILNNAIEPYREQFGVRFSDFKNDGCFAVFTFAFNEVNGRNSDHARIRNCSEFTMLISKKSGVLEDKSACPNGIWDAKYIKYIPTPFEYSYNAQMCSNGQICNYKCREWYGIRPKNNYQYGTEFCDLDLAGLVRRFFERITVAPAKKSIPQRVSKTFASLINKTAKEMGFKVFAELVEMSLNAYRWYVDMDEYRAEQNGDYDWASGTCKAIRLSYPEEYCAMDTYLSTARIKDELRGVNDLNGLKNAIYAMCAI